METILLEKQKRRKDHPNAETTNVSVRHFLFQNLRILFNLITCLLIAGTGTTRHKKIQSRFGTIEACALSQSQNIDAVQSEKVEIRTALTFFK